MKYILILLITLYQYSLSPIFRVVFGAKCRYSVSCSEYAKQSVRKYGIVVGGKKATKRLLSCQALW